MKAVVAAFNQEKALEGAFSVIVQLYRLIVQAPPVMTSLHHGGQLLGKMKSVFNEFMKNLLPMKTIKIKVFSRNVTLKKKALMKSLLAPLIAAG